MGATEEKTIPEEVSAEEITQKLKEMVPSKQTSEKKIATPPTDGDYDGPHKITETVYLSDVFAVISPEGRKELKRLEIKRVLTASHRPVRDDVPPGVRYKFIRVFDMYSADLLGTGVLHEGLKYIDEADAKQESILVHCEAGISRSVTLVCAHLMKKNGWTAEKAIDYIKERRPQADPNDSFRLQLKIFEKAGYNADPSTIYKSSAYAEFTPQLKHFGIAPRHHPHQGHDKSKRAAADSDGGKRKSADDKPQAPADADAKTGCSIL